MSTKDHPVIAALALLAIFIWLKDLSWLDELSDTLPILLAIPAFIWLGMPWRFRSGVFRIPTGGLAASVAGFTLGMATGWRVLLALAWTALLWSWLSVRLEADDRRRVSKLLVLPLMAFPWLLIDGDAIGWWFRLSGSRVTGTLFSISGFQVVQEGTRLLVQGVPIDVSPACSGLHTLQSMLLAGSAMAFVILGHHPIYWANIPLLVVISWIANTLRIIAIAVAAVAVSPQFAQGLFHEWGGWGVLLMMFMLSWGFFTLQKKLLGEQAAAR